MKLTATILILLVGIFSANSQFSLLKDANPGTGDCNSPGIWKFKPGLWMTSFNGGSTAQEIWITDGTTAGTMMVKDLCAGSCWGDINRNSGSTAILNGNYFFAGTEDGISYKLYKTDGTAAGTSLVSPVGIPVKIKNINNTLYFVNFSDGELYKSDGTAIGTVRIKDINPGAAGSISTNLNISSSVFTIANDIIFFRANDGLHGYELWRTDGTEAGTKMVKDILPGSGDGLSAEYGNAGYISLMQEKDGILYFMAQDVIGHKELWRSDGTDAGTYKVSNISSTSTGFIWSNIILMGNQLYFVYNDQSNDQKKIYRSDGTTAGTQELLSQSFNITSTNLAKGVSVFYFLIVDPFQNVMQLWKSNGTPAGTVMVKDGYPAHLNGFGVFYTIFSWNDIYFNADDGQTGSELHFSDGTLAGTGLYFDGWPGPNGSGPVGFTNIKNKLAFRQSNNSVYGQEFWISNTELLWPQVLYFKGKLENNRVRLDWEVINEETSMDRYEVEKSLDSSVYAKIATIQAFGNNGGHYQHYDPDIYPGKFYYRLKVFKTDGSFRYSNIVVIEVKQPATNNPEIQFIYYPNPTSGIINIKVTGILAGKMEIMIADIAGRMVRKQLASIQSSPQITPVYIDNLSKGSYLLSVYYNDQKVITGIFVKQ